MHTVILDFKNLKKNNGLVWFMVFNLYIVAVSLIGGGNWSTWRKHRLMVTSVNSCGLFYCIIIVKYFKVQRKIHKKYSETCGKSRMTVCSYHQSVISPGTPVSSTNKTDCHNIKIKHHKPNQTIIFF
jgi:hypothetical protein